MTLPPSSPNPQPSWPPSPSTPRQPSPPPHPTYSYPHYNPPPSNSKTKTKQKGIYSRNKIPLPNGAAAAPNPTIAVITYLTAFVYSYGFSISGTRTNLLFPKIPLLCSLGTIAAVLVVMRMSSSPGVVVGAVFSSAGGGRGIGDCPRMGKGDEAMVCEAYEAVRVAVMVAAV